MSKSLFSKIAGKGELPIEEMPGFRRPTDAEAKEIEKKFRISIGKDILTTAGWTIICALFSVMYGSMYRSLRHKFLLVSCILFAILLVIGVIRLFFTDGRTFNSIMNRKYTIRSAWIDYVLPGVTTAGGKAAAKIRDEKGNVYSHEFSLSRKIKKLNKSNPDQEYLAIRIDTGMYCLTTPIEVEEYGLEEFEEFSRMGEDVVDDEAGEDEVWYGNEDDDDADGGIEDGPEDGMEESKLEDSIEGFDDVSDGNSPDNDPWDDDDDSDFAGEIGNYKNTADGSDEPEDTDDTTFRI